MTILANRVLGGLRYPSGPVESAPLQLARGIVTLGGAGSVTESIPGFPTSTQVMCQFNSSSPGAVGPLVGGYNPGTGILTITSVAGAADANNIVNYLLYFF
jgi:hypothetical protein